MLVSRGVQAINEALEKEDAEALISSLLSTAAIHNIKSECGETYLQKLTELRTEKARAGTSVIFMADVTGVLSKK